MRIQNEAERLGYKPDPLVSAFTARVRSKRGEPQHIRVGVLHRKEGTNMVNQLEGADEVARQAGYRLEFINFDEIDRNEEKLRQHMTKRNLRNLLIMPLGQEFEIENWDLEGVSGVQIGLQLRQPRLHGATSNFFNNAQLAYQKLWEAGHEQIGLVISDVNDENLDHQWLGGYQTKREVHHPGELMPVLRFRKGELNPEKLAKWVLDHDLSAILGLGYFAYEWLERQPPVNRHKVTYVAMTGGKISPFAGIDERHDKVFSAALNLLISQGYRNETGIPEIADTVMISGIWREGEWAETLI